MKNLEDMLRERVGGDQRAATAVIDVRGDSVRILLGAIGNLGRIVIGVEGDDVRVITPTREQISDAAEADEAGEGDATNVRRIPDLEAGEFVDDRDPLYPGENPLDAVARIESEGLHGRQAEAVTATTGIAYSAPVDTGVTGDDAPAGSSEIKNPVDTGGEGSGESGGGEGDEKKPEAIDHKAHNLNDLKKIAQDEGVELAASDNTKAEIAAAINAKRGIAAE